jgi:hypothetical protein
MFWYLGIATSKWKQSFYAERQASMVSIFTSLQHL